MKPVLARVEDAEKNIRALATNQQQILEAVNGAVARLQQDVSVMDDICNALSDIVGRDNVLAAIKKMVEERAATRAEGEKVRLAEAVSRGELKAAEEIKLESVVVGREFTADGTVYGPGWQQFLVANIKEEGLRDLLPGRKVGEKIPLPSGNQFEVLEIYDVVPPTDGEKVAVEAVNVEQGDVVVGENDEPPVIATPPEVDADADAALEAYLAKGASEEKAN